MTDYLHGYQFHEQERLMRQARFLRPLVHRRISLREGDRVVEIGCGVGAQLKILAEQGPCHLLGVDRSPEQLEQARRLLAQELAEGRVELLQAQAEELPLPSGHFDQVLLFFVLEHVRQPLQVVREAARLLKPGALLTVTEVNNPSLQILPASPALQRTWEAYNQLQRDLGGDPEVGVRLANLALSAGLEVVWMKGIGPVLDDRLSAAQKQEVVDFWLELLESTRCRILQEKRLDEATWAEARRDLLALVDLPGAVLWYGGCQMQARRPLLDGT